MAYVANADIERRVGHAVYVQLTDDEGTGLASEAVVNEARLGAEGEVDSYLGRRYAVPVDVGAHPEVAGVLQNAVLDLAEYRLHARRGAAPAEVKAKRDGAVRWLQEVAQGEATLPSVTEVAANPAVGFMGLAVGGERVMTREEMELL